MRIAHDAVQQHGVERQSPGQLLAQHHHAGHPEEQNVVSGYEQPVRIVALEVHRLSVRPADGRERQQCRREPRVQHIVVLTNGQLVGDDRRPAAVRLPVQHCDRSGARLHLIGCGHPNRSRRYLRRCALVRRHSVTPPQLPRHAPVARLFAQPPVPLGLKLRWLQSQGARRNRLARPLRHRAATPHEPLRPQQQLDHIAAA